MIWKAYLDHAYAQNLAKPPLMRICREFENRRVLRALSGKFFATKILLSGKFSLFVTLLSLPLEGSALSLLIFLYLCSPVHGDDPGIVCRSSHPGDRICGGEGDCRVAVVVHLVHRTYFTWLLDQLDHQYHVNSHERQGAKMYLFTLV